MSVKKINKKYTHGDRIISFFFEKKNQRAQSGFS